MQIIRAADKYTYNTIDGRKLCTSYIITGSLPHNIYIQGLMHPRWCRISSINRRCVRVCTNNMHTIVHFYTLTHITTYQCIIMYTLFTLKPEPPYFRNLNLPYFRATHVHSSCPYPGKRSVALGRLEKHPRPT